MRLMVLFILTCGLLFSCSNEFDLTEDKKDIPVVYGLISSQDTAQYIRIERAFIDESVSALEIAQRPDSLYYMNLDASIVDIESSERFALTRVDGNLEGYVRDQGVFAQAPNYLYKVHIDDFLPIDNKSYRLEIDRGDGKALVTAETMIVDNPTLVAPSSGTELSFRYNLINPGFVDPYRFEWKLTEGVIFDLTLILKYSESIQGGPFENKNIEWKIAQNVEELFYDFNMVSFYSTLAANIEEDASALRLFQNIDVILESGGQEILDFIKVGEANLGITSSQDVPSFTNISEGVGLFSSRARLIQQNYSLTVPTRDSIRSGSLTKHLNFQ